MNLLFGQMGKMLLITVWNNDVDISESFGRLGAGLQAVGQPLKVFDVASDEEIYSGLHSMSYCKIPDSG